MTTDPQTDPQTDRHALDAHRLSPARARYLAAARTALELLDSPEVAQRWDEASVLEGMAVADLAGHLALSGVLIVEQLLDGHDPASAEPVTGGRYYGSFTSAVDPGSELNAVPSASARTPWRSVAVRRSCGRRPTPWSGSRTGS